MRKNMVLISLLIMIGLIIAQGKTAEAKPGRPPCPPSPFAVLDKDSSGEVTWQEYSKSCSDQEAAKRNFDALDQDNDGVLDRTDSLRLFEGLDLNGDRKLSKEELNKRWPEGKAKSGRSDLRPDMDILDRNRDGSVTLDEFEANWTGIPLISW